MRLLVWILGVICTLAALMNAYAVAPRWVPLFWVLLSLWLVVGVAYLVAALVKVIAGQGIAGKVGTLAPRSPGKAGVPARE